MIDEITIEGMGCDHCIRAVEEALEGVEGVEIQTVEIGRARVQRSPDTPTEAVDEAIRGAGYEPVTHSNTEE